MPNHVLQQDCTNNTDEVQLDLDFAPYTGEVTEIWVDFKVAFNASWISHVLSGAGGTLSTQDIALIHDDSSTILLDPIVARDGGVLKWTAYVDGAAFPAVPYYTPPSPIVADQFYCVRLHVDASVTPPICEFWVDGVSVGTIDTTGYSGDPTIRRIALLPTGMAIAGSLAYYDDFTAGTSAGGSDIASDDFESGLSSTVWSRIIDADSSVIVDPGIADCAFAGTTDFTLALAPTSLTINEAGSDTTTVTTTAIGGDTESVTLSASGVPAGVTVAFSPGVITPGGSSTATVTVTGAATPGTYTITITGTGTSNTHSASLTLHVLAADFTIAATPSTVTFSALGTQTVSISTTALGSPETVTLTPTEQTPPPSWLDITFGLAGTVTSGGSTPLTITVSGGALDGSYTLRASGSDANGNTHFVDVTIVVVGNSGPRPKAALLDIACLTNALSNSGLRSLSGGLGTSIASRWAQNGRATAPYDYLCGITDHQSEPFFYWIERETVSDFNASLHVSVHVARYHSGAVEYLGSPFRYGSGQTISYSLSNPFADILGVSEPVIVSDGTDLYCVAQLLVDEQTHGDYTDQVKLWKLACARWEGGTTWSDYGWDEALTVNNAGIFPGDSMSTPLVAAYNAGADADFPNSESGYRAVGACALAGAVYGSWFEEGDTFNVIHTGPWSGVMDTGPAATERWYHFAKFTGPGVTADVVYPLNDVGRVWDGANTDPPGYTTSSVSHAVNSVACGAAGGTPICVVEYDLFPGPVPHLEVFNMDTNAVIQTDWPNTAWASVDTAQFTAPRQLLWDPVSGLYYTAASDTQPALYYVVTLSADGTTWALVARNGGTLPAAGNPVDGIDGFTGLPINHAEPWVGFEPLPVVGVEPENVYLLNQNFAFWAGGDFSIYAWVPCPYPGPYDDSAWDTLDVGNLSPYALSGTSDVLTIGGVPSPPFGPYVAPNPSSGSTWNQNSTVAAAAKIGEHVYVICAELAHAPYDATSGHGDYRVYDFIIQADLDTSTCPVLLLGGLLAWNRVGIST